jgi:hypothetical protein
LIVFKMKFVLLQSLYKGACSHKVSNKQIMKSSDDAQIPFVTRSDRQFFRG